MFRRLENKLLRNINTPPEIVRQLMKTAISIGEIRKAVPSIPVMLYDKIPDNIPLDIWLSKISPKYKCVIILYLWDRTPEGAYGHFISILSHHPNTIEVFDSTAQEPDYLRNLQDYSTASSLGQGTLKILSNIRTNNYDGRYNSDLLQKKNMETCGRWCILRCLFGDYSEEQFASTIKSLSKKYKLSKDYLIVLLTM